MRRPLWIGSLAIIFAAATAPAIAQDAVDGFAARKYSGANGLSMPYRLFVPAAAAPSRPLPIVIYLHGGGGSGTDNLKQISGGNTNGTHVWTRPENQKSHPAFVVAPQAPAGQRWSQPDTDQPAQYAALVLELVDSLSKEFAIDRDRVYVVGQSLGGMGVWDLVSKRPNVFAAGVPLCGEGNVARVKAARAVPIWAFHGAKDPVVPVQGSRDMVAALRAAGGQAKYTEYPEAEHNVWTLAFGEAALPDWLFSQKRKP